MSASLSPFLKNQKKSSLSVIDIAGEEQPNPDDLFSGTTSESSVGIPWELPDSNSEWKIPRTRNQSYYKLVKDKPKIVDENIFESSGKREGSTITRNPIQEELKSKQLLKHSQTGLRKFTRHTPTGKLSKKNELRYWETELERLKEELKSDQKSEISVQNKVLEDLKRRLSVLKNRLDNLYTDKLDGLINLETYQNNEERINQEMDKLIEQIEKYNNDNIDYAKTGSVILELASQAKEIFLNRTSEEKRLLLSFVISNINFPKNFLIHIF